jgi:hypothetical protein
MKKKAKITVETERLLVISRSRQAINHWCHECQTNVKMIRIDLAAAIAGLSERTVFQLAEAGELHFVETSEGQTLFCFGSLAEQRHSASQQLLNAGPSQQSGKD